MTEPLNIIAFSGSLRKASFNTALLREAQSLAPEGVAITLADYTDLPFYNSDLGVVEAVEKLRAVVQTADAVLIATPEYNYGVPGGLKNMLDWLSRPAYQSVFFKKPVGMLSVSPGFIGGARAQGQLKQVLLGMASALSPYAEVAIGNAGQRFVDGKIAQEDTRALVSKYVAEFAAWVRTQPRS